MKPSRRVVLALAIGIALSLVLAPVAFAAAGGGSAGFGGGGGGEGGGGGGGGAGMFILIQVLIRIAVLGHGLGALVLLALGIVYLLVRRGGPRASRFWDAQRNSGRAARRQVTRRARRVETAAAEAAEEDPAFAPDRVKMEAAALFMAVQSAWDAGDRAALGRLLSPDLLREWERRLDDFDRRGWSNRVKPIGDPRVEYVGLSNRGAGERSRVTVRIEATMQDYVVDANGRHIKRAGVLGEKVRVREYWTLVRRGDRWSLQSIQQGAEGQHALEDEIVATPWSDDTTMRDEALVEGAVADAVPSGFKLAELADLSFKGDARAAANDLSVADGRFAPDLLEVAARRAVAAWADAVDGSDQDLLKLARPQAVRELLHPGDPSGATRLVVRGPHVARIRISALDAAAQPPTMAIEVDLTGRRYIEDRATTAVLQGSRSRETGFTERWMLALDGDAANPWRIATVGARTEHAS